MAFTTDAALLGAAGAGGGPGGGGVITDIAVGTSGSPYLSVYPFTSGVGFGAKYTSPTIPGPVYSIAFSPTDIIIPHSFSPFVAAYPFTSGVGFGVKYSNPVGFTAINQCKDACFDNTYSTVFLTHQGAPGLTAYPFTSGVGFGTKYSAPSPINGNGNYVSYSPVSDDVAVSTGTYLYFYSYRFTPGVGFGASYSLPPLFPSSNAEGITYSLMEDTSVVMFVTTTYSNRFYAYPFTSGVGYGSNYANTPSITGDGRDVSATSTDVAVAYGTSPYINVYPFTVAGGFGTKYANISPGLPDYPLTVHLTNTDLAIGHRGSPYVSVYRFTPGVGVGAKYTNPAVLPPANEGYVRFRIA